MIIYGYRCKHNQLVIIMIIHIYKIPVIKCIKILLLFFVIMTFMSAFKTSKIESTVENATEYTKIYENSQTSYDFILPHVNMTEKMKGGSLLEKEGIYPTIINLEEVKKSIIPWVHYIRHYASLYSVETDLVCAIIFVESKGDPFAISEKGAVGLMQIMPSTADFMGFTDVLDPGENIHAGVKYISWLAKNYDESNLLRAWNAGPNTLKQSVLYNETKKFILEVEATKEFLKRNKNGLSLE